MSRAKAGVADPASEPGRPNFCRARAQPNARRRAHAARRASNPRSKIQDACGPSSIAADVANRRSARQNLRSSIFGLMPHVSEKYGSLRGFPVHWLSYCAQKSLSLKKKAPGSLFGKNFGRKLLKEKVPPGNFFSRNVYDLTPEVCEQKKGLSKRNSG